MKKKVIEMFPVLDLSKISDLELEREPEGEEGEGEVDEEVAKLKIKQAGTEMTASESIARTSEVDPTPIPQEAIMDPEWLA